MLRDAAPCAEQLLLCDAVGRGAAERCGGDGSGGHCAAAKVHGSSRVIGEVFSFAPPSFLRAPAGPTHENFYGSSLRGGHRGDVRLCHYVPVSLGAGRRWWRRRRREQRRQLLRQRCGSGCRADAECRRWGAQVGSLGWGVRGGWRRSRLNGSCLLGLGGLRGPLHGLGLVVFRAP